MRYTGSPYYHYLGKIFGWLMKKTLAKADMPCQRFCFAEDALLCGKVL